MGGGVEVKKESPRVKRERSNVLYFLIFIFF